MKLLRRNKVDQYAILALTRDHCRHKCFKLTKNKNLINCCCNQDVCKKDNTEKRPHKYMYFFSRRHEKLSQNRLPQNQLNYKILVIFATRVSRAIRTNLNIDLNYSESHFYWRWIIGPGSDNDPNGVPKYSSLVRTTNNKALCHLVRSSLLSLISSVNIEVRLHTHRNVYVLFFAIYIYIYIYIP